jgi:hypothetical protein
MKSILRYFSSQIAKTRTVRAKAFIRSSLLFLTLGVGAVIGAAASSNQIPILIVANAQLEDTEELREEQRAREIEEEFSSKQGQNQDDKEAAITGSNELSLTLERAHFIPLSPLSDSPGNQVKMLLDYTIDDPSALADDTTVSAIMEVYVENQTLLRTSSLPEPIVIDDSEGPIQLATTLDDNSALQNITARALITDSQKVNPLSDTIEANMGLGEIKSLHHSQSDS